MTRTVIAGAFYLRGQRAKVRACTRPWQLPRLTWKRISCLKNIKNKALLKYLLYNNNLLSVFMRINSSIFLRQNTFVKIGCEGCFV